MTKLELFELHKAICAEALDIMVAKNTDYSAGDEQDDPFKNFKGSVVFGVEPEIGTMIRMQDKFMRVLAYIRNGKFAVKSENIRDIVHDLVNYSILLGGQMIDRTNAAQYKSTQIYIEANKLELEPGTVVLSPEAFVRLERMLQGWAGDATAIPLRLDKMIKQIDTDIRKNERGPTFTSDMI